MTYNPGQFRSVLPFIVEPPTALVLAGPADGNEAQIAVELWPSLIVVGIEPYPPAREYQLRKRWPGENLLPAALSDSCGTERLYLHPDAQTQGRASRLRHDFGAGFIDVPTITLDEIDRRHLAEIRRGVFLWLDIEGAELRALRGATQLLESGKVSYVNVEALDRCVEENAEIDRILTDAGLSCVGEWNVQPGLVRDKFYRRIA